MPNIDPNMMYESVRQEILDQKRCQFHIFSAAVTVTAGVMAFAASTKVGPIVYTAPVLLNVLALTIILDKAISIQRMVGYLQLMESEDGQRRWMWEYHLNAFREVPGKSMGTESGRRHNYIRNVALMLILLNAGMTLLYFWGPEAVALKISSDYQRVRELYGAINVTVVVLNAMGIGLATFRWGQLVMGKYTSAAIRERWRKVLSEKGS